ncbi:hypothetical protein ECANGB1_1625 [Enterospora canceri]|uniref:Uncharacterized protein n=1 Tax=Enterospora canceri TaxID=1081671 RepID=A0A1Y1S5K7_9MICR|nr:hypothetical protein ECANGB1_1625 [Enterospora canceri]
MITEFSLVGYFIMKCFAAALPEYIGVFHQCVSYNLNHCKPTWYALNKSKDEFISLCTLLHNRERNLTPKARYIIYVMETYSLTSEQITVLKEILKKFTDEIVFQLRLISYTTIFYQVYSFNFLQYCSINGFDPMHSSLNMMQCINQQHDETAIIKDILHQINTILAR